MSKQSRTVRSHLADRRSRVNKHTSPKGGALLRLIAGERCFARIFIISFGGA